jgi:hypothetical protein
MAHGELKLFGSYQHSLFNMQNAIGLHARANGLEFVLLVTSWILIQMIVLAFVQSQKALHAFHSTHISIAAYQVCTWVFLISSIKNSKQFTIYHILHS